MKYKQHILLGLLIIVLMLVVSDAGLTGLSEASSPPSPAMPSAKDAEQLDSNKMAESQIHASSFPDSTGANPDLAAPRASNTVAAPTDYQLFQGTVLYDTHCASHDDYYGYMVRVDNIVSGNDINVGDEVVVVTDRDLGFCYALSGRVDAAAGDYVEVSGPWLYNQACYDKYIDVCGNQDAYILKQTAPPDFVIDRLYVIPSSPGGMEESNVFIHIRNNGEDYSPVFGTFDLQLRIALYPDENLTWIYEGALPSLSTGQESIFQVTDFLFFYEGDLELEACVFADDPEQDTTNNCNQVAVTTTDGPVFFTECTLMFLTALDAFIEITPLEDPFEIYREATSLMTIGRAELIASCDSGQEACYRSVAFYTADVVIFLARQLAESTILEVISFTSKLVDHFFQSAACGDEIFRTQRLFMEAWNREGMEVNSVASMSPIYTRVTDSQGRTSGFLDDGTIINQIPDAEIIDDSGHGHRAIVYPGHDTELIEVKGFESGTFDLMFSVSRPDPEILSLKYGNVAVSALSFGYIDMTANEFLLRLDFDGDGTIDQTIEPIEEIHTPITYQSLLPMIVR